MRRRMFALVSAGVATVALSGCGGSDASREDAVRAAVETWSAAGEENDASTYCDLLSADLRSFYDDAGEQLAGAGEDPCEAVVGTQAELEVDDTGSEVTIDPVTVDGDEATADVSITLPP